MTSTHLRWFAVSAFLLSSTLNYLDRQLLAALAPTLKIEFHLNNEEYGEIQSVFYFVYAFVAPVAGWFVDRVGLNLGTSIAVAAWSVAGTATGLVSSFPALLACRTALGAAEAAGLPSTGKVYATYLESKEMAFGAALNQISITLGSVAAPLVVAAVTPGWGWRSAFVLCGLLGFLWLPLWWFLSARVPQLPVAREMAKPAIGRILRDARLWGLIAGNALVMTVYALWTNWVTLFFVHERHLSQLEANQRYAWIPAVFAGAGGIAGAWMSYRQMRSGVGVIPARLRVCWLGAVMLLATSLVPLMPTDTLAAAAISLSFFFTLTLSTNIYPMPIDVFGVERAAFGVGALTCGYGLMQTFISPLIGAMVDRAGFAPVCMAISICPLLGVGVLQLTVGREAAR